MNRKIYNKTKKTRIMTVVFLSVFAVSLIGLPPAIAHTPPWKIPTFAYLHVSPNPVGVGQEVTVVFWLDKIYDNALMTNDYRFHNFKLTITAPDGSIQTITRDIVWDTTSSQYTTFTPTQIGSYIINFTFPGQNINDYSHDPTSQFVNDSYVPSSASTILIVQDEPVSGMLDSYPLPTEYWTRPIEGQNTNWYKIASNWLGYPGIVANYQPDGIAPSSPHIMWTKPIQDGGVVGGTNTGENGTTFYSGLSYETKYNPVIIMNGRIYYPLPKSNNGASGFGTAANYNGYACVDLRTGEELFRQNMSMPSFGQLLNYDDPNQHGVIPNGYLWTVQGTTWMASDPLDGNWLFNITNVPRGTLAYGSNGEILIYALDTTSKTLTVWNSTAVITTTGTMYNYRPVGRVFDTVSKGPTAYSLNVTEPWLPRDATIVRVFPDDILLGRNGTLPSSGGAYPPTYSSAPYTMWAINLNSSKGTVGRLLWLKNYDAPTTNTTITIGVASWPTPVDQTARVFCTAEKETFQWTGYNLDTGAKLWGPTTHNWDSFQYYHGASGGPNMPRGFAAYGNLYVGGYGGEIVAFDMKTGAELWTYNNTKSGTNTVYGHYPIFISSIADGKIYAHTSEHSPNSPPYKGALIRCINATTGAEIWTLPGWNTFTPYGANLIEPIYIADGYANYLNVYDMQIYTIGKGPSKTTVDAPLSAVPEGSSVVIRGTVTDISPGIKQNEQEARFPNGVPCVSDESMSEWMQYVYMQKPKPANVTGVPVTLSVLDANGNYRIIGTTTTTDGFFTFHWKPDIPGQYIVYASFSGSESYWPSSAMVSFAVDPAPATATPQPTAPPSAADLYFIPAVIGIIVAIFLSAAAIVLLIRKRP